MSACYDCPRECGADRDSAVGACGGGYYARVAKTVDPFLYEEPCLGELSAVFFSGCALRCSYCQNHEISRGGVGRECDDESLAALFDGVTPDNALDLVTPSHYLAAIERALPHCRRTRKIIWNTSGYEKPDAVARAARFTDVFLADFKYASADIAARFSRAPDYPEVAVRALAKMRETADVWRGTGEDRVLERGLIVRHLVLPGCAADSMRVLDIIKAELGTDTVISLMSQFTPNGVGEPSAPLKRIEYKLVAEHAIKLGFAIGYFQDLSSADSSFTPDFGGGER